MFSHLVLAALCTPISSFPSGCSDNEAALIINFPLDSLFPPGRVLAFRRGLGLVHRGRTRKSTTRRHARQVQGG